MVSEENGEKILLFFLLENYVQGGKTMATTLEINSGRLPSHLMRATKTDEIRTLWGKISLYLFA